MALKLQSDCQLEGTVRRHPTWFQFVPVILWRIKAFHPATVSSRFKAGPAFDTFIQFLESESGWKSYPTCQGTPRPTLVEHTSSMVLTCTMSPKRKMVSLMRSAAIWRLSTFRCRNLKERSVELISRGIKYFCAACLDPQCRSIKCARCKPALTMTGLTPFDANCRFDYTSGRTSTTGRKRSMETYLRIDLVEIIEYASIRKTIHRGCTLTKWIGVN